MGSLKIKVQGMTCDHCVQTIKKAVGGISGVQQVEVDLEKQEVAVEFAGNHPDLSAISSKITEVGYEVVAEKG